ncbi:hypothetical protein [Streptomyces sp. NRRL F-5630]|uniref:hypothetical protein n=1 Tax=Streptomyces sp. NRRL F-5630 TaxID=1463864 RepID=UPI003D724BBC
MTASNPSTLRAVVRRDRKAGRLRRHHAKTVLSVCDLAERHDRLVPAPGQTVGFLGLGNLRAVLADTDREADWFFVHEVLEISGATAEDWHRIHDEEITEAAQEPAVLPRVDEYTMHTPDGDQHQVPVCNWQIALLLALEGPWGPELMRNVEPALQRSILDTGAGDNIAVARVGEDGVFRETGESLSDAIRAGGPLPSPEVIRHQIQAGPLASFRDGGQA